MTLHTDVVAAFAAALVDFPVNHDRPNDAYVQLVVDTISTILYSLNYDTVADVHDLMGIIQDQAAYFTKYAAWSWIIPIRLWTPATVL